MKLKSLNTFIEESLKGYTDKDITGLHGAKSGDFIEIGFEGTRVKQRAKIDKVVSNNRLQDTEGNIFNRDGQIFRKKSSWVKVTGDKIVSARQITQKEYKESIISFVSEQLQKYEWSKLDIDKLKEVGKIIGRSFPQLEDF